MKINNAITLLGCALATSAYAGSPITAAVIDTGVDARSVSHLCKYGHRSFSPVSSNPLVDINGHGTHVAGLVEANAGSGNYCIVSLKFVHDVFSSKEETLKAMTSAIRYAININVKVINISGGGMSSSEEEKALIKEALDKGIKVVVAAGNESHDLDSTCNYFPACYDPRLIVVGNLKPNMERNPSSNSGFVVNRWVIGTNLKSKLPGNKTGYMTGTSQATAVVTGKTIANLK